MLFIDLEADFSINGWKSSNFLIGWGVRKGYPLALYLF